MKYLYAALAGATLMAASAVPAQAATETFGQFAQRAPNAKLFSYTKLDSGAVKKAEIKATSVPVYYILGLSWLPADLAGPQNAHLSADFVSNLGTTGSGASRVQMFDTVTSGSISFTRDTAADEGNGTRTNLLTVSFTKAELNASQNGDAFTFKSDPDSVITFTSDFLDFTDVVTKDFSFSFSGASPTFLSATPGASSRSMTFSGTGTFASDPAPLISGVPEPTSWAMMVGGFGLLGLSLRSRKSANSVTFA